ncbi:TraG family conjugative transposon ATPase [Kaistella pullorum]|uniref:TraG family conjugative transposon ATPase n=1 Tax=Kaistella pullorum TaxID=2763074 RepID=A0ABR8WQ41_9FLAO|nr:TraG family conjugative transposon ATPase [Kaistella pullorum]MBD8019057.1 TraG family conjugative transposon ATPase [Kaistella pullorum]
MNNLFLHIENNKVVGTNGVFAMGYVVQLAERYSLGQEDYQAINDLWNRALKDMPGGAVFLKQDIFQEAEFDTRHLPDGNYLQRETKQHFKDRPFLAHKCHIFFVLPPGDTFTTKITNPFKRLNRKKFERFDDRINVFINTVEQAVNFLNGGRINSGRAFQIRSFEAGEMVDYYDYYFNNFQNDFVTDRILKSGYIQIGDRLLGAICTRDEEHMPESFPELQSDRNFSTAKYKFYQNIGDLLGFELPFDHVYNQIIYFEDNQKQLAELRRRHDLLKKSSTFDPQNKVNAGKLGVLIDEIAADIDSERLVRTHINVLFYGDNEAEIKSRRNQITEKFKSVDIKTRQPIGNFLNSVYCNSFYLFSGNFSDQQMFYGHLSLATLFINNCTNYKNDAQGVLLNSRIANIPVTVDTWDEEKKYVRARNFMIFAPTGYGKSFFANHLFRQYYEENARMVLVDLGGSYRKLAALYPEDTAFIHYREGTAIGLNPFDLQGDKLSASKIEDLTEFLITHYKRDTRASENEKTALRKIIEAYYEQGGAQSLLKFIEAVREHKDTLLAELNIRKEFFNIEEFLFAMSEFEPGGIYDFLYADESNENLVRLKDKKIIVFELDEVKDNPLLLSIMLQLISSVINETVWKDKSTRGYIFFDEVAKQFKFKGVLEKIEYFFQAVRKQNGAIGIVLQAVSQLPESGEFGQIAKTIIENTQVLYVLHAKDYTALKERFGMSEHAFHQMSSLTSDFEGKNKYSEIFVMRGNQHQVYRLEVPEKVFWAYQTEGAQNEQLMNIYEETRDMEEAIDKYIKKG